MGTQSGCSDLLVGILPSHAPLSSITPGKAQRPAPRGPLVPSATAESPRAGARMAAPPDGDVPCEGVDCPPALLSAASGVTKAALGRPRHQSYQQHSQAAAQAAQCHAGPAVPRNCSGATRQERGRGPCFRTGPFQALTLARFKRTGGGSPRGLNVPCRRPPALREDVRTSAPPRARHRP
jgi:hypothetical protein